MKIPAVGLRRGRPGSARRRLLGIKVRLRRDVVRDIWITKVKHRFSQRYALIFTKPENADPEQPNHWNRFKTSDGTYEIILVLDRPKGVSVIDAVKRFDLVEIIGQWMIQDTALYAPINVIGDWPLKDYCIENKIDYL